MSDHTTKKITVKVKYVCIIIFDEIYFLFSMLSIKTTYVTLFYAIKRLNKILYKKVG